MFFCKPLTNKQWNTGSWSQKLRYAIIAMVIFFCFILNDFYKSSFEVEPLKLQPILVHTNAICKDILCIQDPKKPTSHRDIGLSMEEIAESKRTNRHMKNIYYYILGKFLPSLFEDTEPFKGIDGSNFTIPQESRLDRLKWQIPYLPCRLREYTGADVNSCILRRNKMHKHFKISFIGDSRVRRPTEYLLELLHRYNLTIEISDGTKISLEDFLGDKGNILWPKYKQKFIVHSHNLPNFLISYTWAPYLSLGDDPYPLPFYEKYLKHQMFSALRPKEKKSSLKINEMQLIRNFKNPKLNITMRSTKLTAKNNGAMDELKRLLKKPSADLPDFILIDTSSWQMTDHRGGILRNLDQWAVEGTLTIRKKLEKLGARTTVVYLLPHPFKDYVNIQTGVTKYFKIQNNHNQEWFLNAQIQLLPKNVLIWDSMLPFAFAAIDDCVRILNENVNKSLLPKIQRFGKDNSYACTDKMHNGHETNGIAVQMLLNQICNKDMNAQKDIHYCCDDR